MIGLVLISHGELALELRRSLEAISGVQPHLATVCVNPNDHPDERRSAVARAIAETDDGEGVIVVADMFGATPCNLAVSLAERSSTVKPEVDVIAGVNLPMLVEIAKARSKVSLVECVARATAAGRHYISSASEVLAHADIQAATAKSNGSGANGGQANGRADSPSHSSCLKIPPSASRSGIAAGAPSSPYEIGSAAAHKAAMTQNADAPSRS